MFNAIRKIVTDKNFLSLLGNVITAALGFLTFFVLVRSLEQDPFGEWVLFITAATLIDLLRFGITRVGLTRFLSGAKPDERKHFIGSSWLIGLLSIAAMGVLLYPLALLFPETIKNSGFNLFFLWYVPLALSNLPWGNATSILQADEKFDKILLIRFINTGGFLLFLVLNYYLWRVNVEWIVIWNIITNVLTSILCTVFNWDGSWYILSARRYTTKITLNFGKYSMGTSIGSSLLKSADSFIIGLSPFLGTTGVALYSIPIKFTEAVEIIIRSFGATSFPKLSKFSIEGNIHEFRRVFYQYSGFLTYLLIPIAIVSAFFAKDFVMLLGGKQYEDAADGLAIVMQMFIIFSLFLPIDRFTGIGLDAINKPDKNFYKTLIMTTTNIIGDLIAVFFLHWLFPSLSVITILIFISIGSIGFEVVGVVFGIYYLNKEIPLRFFSIFTEGLVVYKDLYEKALTFLKR